MALSDKNIVITPNIGQNSDPKIAFSGANTAVGAQTINLNVYPNDGGTISFEGSAGQLFSITNKLTETIFSVNDVSGIPSIEVLDTGTVRLAQYSGNVGIGIAAPVTKLETYVTVNSLQIISSVRNDQAGTGVAAIGFNVSSSAAADTSAVKAGIGLIRQSPQGVGQINFYNRSTQDTSSFTATDIRGAISAGGIWSLGAAPGSESLRVTPVASAVNYLEAQGQITTGGPSLIATGSDTNVPLLLKTKGTGSVNFYTSGATLQFLVGHVASAVNYLQVTGGATTAGVNFSAQGSDANIFITYDTKGTEAHSFRTNAGAQQQFRIAHTASAVNYLQVTGNTTTNAPEIRSNGSDANIALSIFTKGTGAISLRTDRDGTPATQFVVAHTASAVNYLQVTGAATANFPQIQMAGADTNVGLNLSTKGTGTFGFYGQSFSTIQFAVGNTASAVNYITAFGNITGSGGYFQATGSDTNIAMLFSAKGSGGHTFYTAGNSFTPQFSVSHTASAVNFLQVTGGATGVGAALSAQGSDTNITNFYSTKGTGAHSFFTGGGNQFIIANVASAVNAVVVYGSATGTAVQLVALGSDTNIDLALTPKGSGYVVVKSAYSTNLTLTDAATITWDTSTAGGQVATFTFVSTNRTMGAPTNLKNGGFYALAVIQNAGSNTLSWNAIFKWANGTTPTLSTAAGAKDYFTFRSDGTNLYEQGRSQGVS